MEHAKQALTFLKLSSHQDGRGTLTEIFRNKWVNEPPVQWNVVRSKANVLRGVHVHIHHADYLLVLRGSMLLGLCDLREERDSFMQSSFTELKEEQLTLVSIPVGVAHGFYFPEPTDYLYSVSHYWDPVNDELACAWNDPGLKLAWPTTHPILSERDQAAPPLSTLLETLHYKRSVLYD